MRLHAVVTCKLHYPRIVSLLPLATPPPYICCAENSIGNLELTFSNLLLLLQLKLSFYGQQDLPVQNNDDRHWDFMLEPGGPQAAAAAAAHAAATADYHHAAHLAAAAAHAPGPSRGDGHGRDGHHGRAADDGVPRSPRSPRSKRQALELNAPVTGVGRLLCCVHHALSL